MGLLTIIFLSKSTRVKGLWEITYEENGSYVEAGTVRISSSLPCGRKKKFLFHEMITQVNRFAEDQVGVANISGFLQDAAVRNIQIKGITFGSTGFIVDNIPKGQSVTVEYLGRICSKKVKVTGGRVRFTVRTTDAFGISNELIITMSSAGR